MVYIKLKFQVQTDNQMLPKWSNHTLEDSKFIKKPIINRPKIYIFLKNFISNQTNEIKTQKFGSERVKLYTLKKLVERFQSLGNFCVD